MSETLPANWIEANLSSAVIYGKGKKPKKLSTNPEKDTVPYINIKAFEQGIINEYADIKSSKLIDCEDILVVWDGARFGLTGMGMKGAAGSTLMVLKPVLCYPKYIYSFINRCYSFINSKPKGTGTPHVNPDIFWNLQFPLAPLNEQKRIVAKLDKIMPRIDSVKARLDRVPTIIKRFRQSVLTAAVTGKLTEKWREEHLEVESAEALFERIGRERKEKYKRTCFIAKEQKRGIPSPYRNIFPNIRQDSNLYELPLTWLWADLTFLMDENEPFCYGVVQPGPITKNGNYLIRSGDLKNKTVRMDELRTISQKVDEQYKRSKIQGGEILITVVGAGIGTASIAPLECKGYNIARAVAKVPVKDFDSLYVLLWLSTSTARSWLIGESREVARPTLNLEQLATILVPVPPLKEQKEIVRQVDKLFALADKLESHYQKAKTHVDKLSQSVLAKAFRGELVPQDPNDESAEKLLERIIAEKAKMEGGIKKAGGRKKETK